MAERALAQFRPGKLRLAPEDRAWLQKRWDRIRQSAQRADRADDLWNDLNDAFNEKIRAENLRRRARGMAPHSDLSVVQQKENWLPLKDALETGRWHAANAQRHIDDVALFLRLKELELL